MLALLACAAPEVDTALPEESEPELVFRIAAIADPHVYGEEYRARLESTVTWINDQDVELVVVLGDVGWGDGLELAHEELEKLSMPYLPVIGDNEPHFGDDENFDVVFDEQFAELEELGEDWTRAEIPVVDPETGETLWLQNYALTWKGLRLVVLDWASRSEDMITSETGDTHDFAGGTLEFLVSEMQGLEAAEDESVVMLTHNPMFLIPGGFDLEQSAAVWEVIDPDKVAMNLAGHFHIDHDEEVPDGGYDVHVVDAVWDDVKTVRLVEVHSNGLRFSYEHELAIVP